MCGICGVSGPAPVEEALLKRMADTLFHRGPDDEGFFRERGLGLGMRRLSIIDVAGGHQPLTNEDGNVVVIANGEIYNHRDLRNGLAARGHVFRTHSDVECIAHLYEEKGPDFVSDLRGMFAIALYDRPQKRLVLARDRLGKKPLFYAQDGETLLFGSEMKPILVAAPSLREMNERALHPFLRFGFIPEPETIYKRIRKLPPGHLLVFEGGEPRVRRYWDMTFEGSRFPVSKAELDRQLEDAVGVRLESEVPLGAFLSGGPDSSLVVAYMSRLSAEPVSTFTIAFEEEAFDESSDARRVAEHCRTKHRVETLRLSDIQRDFFGTVDAIMRHTGEPFGDSSSFPTWHVCRLARKEVTVALAGDGADEVFGGYTIYQGLRFAELYRHVPADVRRRFLVPALRAWAGRRSPGPGRWSANRWLKRFEDSELPLPAMLASKFSVASREIVDGLVPSSKDLLTEFDRAGTSWIPLGDSADPFDQVVYATTRFLMVNDMLVKVDRMSMAHSLEIRCPYLDQQVVELAARIPPAQKLRRWKTKALLRDVAAMHLPAGSAGKKKHGFGVPIPLWFRGPLWEELRDRLLSSDVVRLHLDRNLVSTLLDRHREGVEDVSQLLWCLLALDAWHRRDPDPG